MEQFSPPLRAERAIADEEMRRFKDWAAPRLGRPRAWDDRMHEEWQVADLVWVPSSHLIPLCERYGADPTKFRVVRYPIPSAVRANVTRPRERGRLRVMFAGTLMLEKGVQYIYEALRHWNHHRVDMHFFGPSQLTSTGLRRLADVGTVHGQVTRSTLLREFARSDVLLFPSLSEGSALVTAEAAGIGLPVLATRESGPPDSALRIEARSAQAIRDALERLLETPESLQDASRASLSEAGHRTSQAFNQELADLARGALDARFGHALR